MSKEKNRKQKVFIAILALFFVILSFMIFDADKYGLCSTHSEHCFFDGWRFSVAEPLFIMSVGLFFTSLLTFFISVHIFKKWLIFTSVWMVATAIFIILAPIRARDYFNLGPTKESVSTWMSSLFAIISILMFIIMRIREREKTHSKK